MKKLLFAFVLSLFLLSCSSQTAQRAELAEKTIGGGNMKLTSNAFGHEGDIPVEYTCQGQDINPELKWDNVPQQTKSFALIFDDPDAPGKTWKHWLIKNIPAGRRSIEDGSTAGEEIENDFGRKEYGGPCPPSGTHRYFFRLYALDTESLDAGTAEELYSAVEKHKIGEAMLMGKYKKS
ncbi:YbhB/YbcL family Raf kinase inhibitor-like protein [Candidatus Woesearchaeota archaeon]|nr:YbhB/YbcL family Raf kinase inhibitor-like protein [Candidatus Woesearchaeota archaeon]